MGNGLTRFALTLLGVSVAAALFEWLAPAQEGLKKHLHLVSALCLLCVLAAPLGEAARFLTSWSPGDWLLGFLDGNEDGDGEAARERYRAEFEDALTRQGLENARQSLENGLCARFGIAPDNCRVTLTWADPEDGEVPPTATVVLSGAAIWLDPRGITEYVRETTGFACRVSVAMKSGKEE